MLFTRNTTSEWRYDPTNVALMESAWRGEKLPVAFRIEVGRRLLLAELEFSEWILRRVEKVRFERDRSVSRSVDIDLNVRSDAPVFLDSVGRQFWLVPLSLMRRRTLVNLEIRDESGRPMTMPGIRLTQRLDQAMLLAAAFAHDDHGRRDDGELRRFVQTFVSGNLADVRAAMATFEQLNGTFPDCHKNPGWESPSPSNYLAPWRDRSLFIEMVYRLRRNFSLYQFLPVEEGRHRLLHVGFDEPTDWMYRTSSVYRERSEDVAEKVQSGVPMRYRVNDRVPWAERSHHRAALGLRPTRVRFQIPGAENASSYHFEVTAPQGVRIVGASLLAGRPNDPERHVSIDSISGHAPTVGLHVIEVPNGSLCRAQIDLRVTARGWLTTMVLSCWAILLVLISVAIHYHNYARWPDAEKTNVFLMLITTSAGVAALLAQSDSRGVAARMLARLRTLGAAATALPLVGAGLVAYPNGSKSSPIATIDRWTLYVVTLVSMIIVTITSVVWWRTWDDERKGLIEESPWDMTRPDESRTANQHEKEFMIWTWRAPLRLSWVRAGKGTPSNETPIGPTPRPNYMHELRKNGFDTPAVAILSSEGFHERYEWNDQRQKEATAALHQLGKNHSAPHVSHFVDRDLGDTKMIAIPSF